MTSTRNHHTVAGDWKAVAAKHRASSAAFSERDIGGALGGRPAEPGRDFAALAKPGRCSSLFADTSDGLIAAAHALAADPDLRARAQLIGTSVWSRAQVFANPVLAGGWFATPDTSGVPLFVGRYRSRFGEDPSPRALLVYDAVAPAISLHRTYGSRAFSAAALTDPSGFLGPLGPFRFRDDGTIERALALCRVTPSGGAVVSPAPGQF